MADSNKMEEKFSTADIQKITNVVSGDGRQFVAQLKSALIKFAKRISKDTQTTVDDVTSAFGQVINIDLIEQHTSDANGQPENDILVTWQTGTVTNYNGATVWYQYGDGEYQYAGSASGKVFTIKDVSTGQYTVKVVGVNKYGISCSFDDAPHESITIRGTDRRIGPPDQFGVTWEGGTPHWYWDGVNDADYFNGYELRENTTPGKFKGMLDSTTDVKSTAIPSERSGTAYLFVRNSFGLYGEGLAHQYELATPSQPNAPTIENLFQGFNIHMDSLPTNCTGFKISATKTDTEKEYLFVTQNDIHQMGSLEGNYDFKYCFYDCFGNGEWSPSVNADVTKQVDGDSIADGAITSDKIAAGAVTVDQLAANAVTAEKIMAGAVTAEAIAANSISTEKLAADNIELSGGLQISGGAVNLSEDGFKVTQSNGESIMFDAKGMTFYDSSGNAYNSVRRMIIGTAKHNQTVTFPVAWPQAPKVLITPLSVTTANNNKDGAIIRIHCRATNITTSGFKVLCYSGIDNADYFLTLNTTFGSFSNVRCQSSSAYTTLVGSPFVYEKDISIDSRARIIKLQFYFSGTSSFKGNGIAIGSGSYITVTANGTTCLSQTFSGGTNDVYSSWFDNWNGVAITTNEFQIPSVTSIHVKVSWNAKGNHQGKNNDSYDVASGKCVLQNISGTMQADDSTEIIDQDGTALFLAIDQSTQNYSVS